MANVDYTEKKSSRYIWKYIFLYMEASVSNRKVVVTRNIDNSNKIIFSRIFSSPCMCKISFFST